MAERSLELPRRPSFPRLPLFAAIALVAFTALATVFGQVTGVGTLKVTLGAPLAMRDLTLTRDGEQVVVRDSASGLELARLSNTEANFVSGSLRGLERMRVGRDISAEQPYRVIQWQNGWVSLSDTGTGQRLYLNAFGPDNVAAFTRFLDLERKN